MQTYVDVSWMLLANTIASEGGTRQEIEELTELFVYNQSKQDIRFSKIEAAAQYAITE